MKFITKVIIVCLVLSVFLLATLQINRIINNNYSNNKILGVTTSSENNTYLCNVINSLRNKYCLNVISSTTKPNTNIGQTRPNNNLSTNPKNLSTKSVGRNQEMVSWTTDKKVKASVFYGTNMASLLLMANDSEATLNHQVYLGSLKPNTTYYYKIVIDENNTFDNNGSMYSFKNNY